MKKQVLSLAALLLVLTASMAQAQISRTATAASYLERGNAWYAKGELERTLADYDLALSLDPRHAAAYRLAGLRARQLSARRSVL
jgi:hypothetical protein